MPITVEKDKFDNITEIWGIGSNIIQVTTRDNKTIRISALHNIRSGANPNYYAAYEEQVEMKVNGKVRKVWVNADYHWEKGTTAEECLEKALVWVSHPKI